MTARQSFLQFLVSLPSRVGARIFRHGLFGGMAWLRYQFSWRYQEWRLGIKTKEFARGIVVPDDGDAHGYEPIDYRVMECVLDYLQPQNQGGFLDYGCGMGRAVILAALRPYDHVVGLERNPLLADIATENLTVVRQRKLVKAKLAEVVCEDARFYEVPPTISHVFLFNSFTGQILRDALGQIRRSLCVHPRDLQIVYLQPINDTDVLQEFKWLEFESEVSTGFWDHVRGRVYRAKLSQLDCHPQNHVSRGS